MRPSRQGWARAPRQGRPHLATASSDFPSSPPLPFFELMKLNQGRGWLVEGPPPRPTAHTAVVRPRRGPARRPGVGRPRTSDTHTAWGWGAHRPVDLVHLRPGCGSWQAREAGGRRVTTPYFSGSLGLAGGDAALSRSVSHRRVTVRVSARSRVSADPRSPRRGQAPRRGKGLC